MGQHATGARADGGRAMSEPTPYIESNILLAAQSGDIDGATEKIRLLLPGERRALFDACNLVHDLVRRVEREAARDG